MTATTDLKLPADRYRAWQHRTEQDRRRAESLPAGRRRLWEAVLDRAVANEAEAVILTGSTVRLRRTSTSDLDFMIVGARPRLGTVREDVDMCAMDADTFWTRLNAGDDYVLWTMRFGWILHDRGVVCAAMHHVERTHITPSAARKFLQVKRGLHLARLVLESGDVNGTCEQCRAALTTVGRWVLISRGVFPLSRAELQAQLIEIDQSGLAAAVDATIGAAPEPAQLSAALELAESFVAKHGAPVFSAAAAPSRRSSSSAGW